MKFLKAEFLKLKQAKIMAIVISLPLIYTSLFSAYFLLANRFTQAETMLVYFELFNYSLILVAAILISFLIEGEANAGKFANLLRFPQRHHLFVSKLIIYATLLSLAQFVGTSSFLIIWTLFGRMTMAWMVSWIKVSLLINVANLSLIPIYVFCGYLFGLIGNVTLAIMGIITSAILGGTDLGQGIWQWVPFTWSRISLADALAAKPLLPLISLFIIFLIICNSILIGWFNRWQGHRFVD